MHHDYDIQSDRKIILGPIFKYAAIGITIGIVFITGTVTLEHKVNTFEQDISELKAQLASENEAARNKGADKSGAITAHEQQTSVESDAIIAVPSTEAASATNEPDTARADVDAEPTVIKRASSIIEESMTHDQVQAATRTANVVADGIDSPENSAQTFSDTLPGESPIEEVLRITINQPDILDQQVNTDSLYQDDNSESGEEHRTASSSARTYDNPQSEERLSHEEWVEQQRLRHEQWLEEVEARRKDVFDTLKASQPFYHVDAAYDKRERM